MLAQSELSEIGAGCSNTLALKHNPCDHDCMNTDVQSKRVTVMGLGRFGGGVGVARWLAGQGAEVLVTDAQPIEKLADSLAQLGEFIADGRIALRLGEHRESDFANCDLVVANPAVPTPWTNRYISTATAAGVPVTTEIRLLTERVNRKRTIGVTGSAGKSTTTAMIHHILHRAGERSHLGGNIGGSLLNSLHTIQADDWIVLELSSAMLHWLGEGIGGPHFRGWSPHVAVLTNINPNHIDWHGSLEHYRDSKQNIFRYQSTGDHPLTVDMLENSARPIPLAIPGTHNQLNAHMAVAAVQRAIGLASIEAELLLADFPGLPHRLSFVAEFDGLRFFNDSKSTTPESTLLAVSAFPHAAKVHLIAGGYDKKIDLSAIARTAAALGGLYTIGSTGQALAAAAKIFGAGSAESCNTLDAAVELAIARMKTGDVLLLSPGCASWDQFTNYEQRGEAFVRLVTQRMPSTIRR
jgi:UDP-N-acetylmuramoylalanine--D-glutamate ligase